MESLPFGSLVRRKRIEAEITQRGLADMLGISHVFLREVELGSRRTLARRHWSTLLEALQVTEGELEQAALDSRLIKLDPRTVAARRLILALEERMREDSLSDADAERLLELLTGRADRATGSSSRSCGGAR